MAEGRVRVSRKELYELVWSSPVESVAERYGMSGVALAKHLKKMAIPRPGRGYWQQLQAGMKPKRAPLGKSPARTPEEITFMLRQRTPRPPGAEGDRPSVPIREALERPDPIVRRLRELLKASYRDHDLKSVSGDGHSVLKVGPTNEKRALVILDAMIGGLRARGHDVRLIDTSDRRHRLEAVIAGRAVEFWITEHIKRTEKAAADLAKRDALSLLLHRRYEYAPSGQLVLEISAPWGDSSVRRRWADGAKQKIEHVLGDVVLGLELAATAWTRWDEARERERKTREEQEREVAAEKRRVAHRAAMSDHLLKVAHRWQDAQTVSAFLAAVEARVPASERSTAFSIWLAWAEKHARHIDPLSTPEKLAMPLEPGPDAGAAPHFDFLRPADR